MPIGAAANTVASAAHSGRPAEGFRMNRTSMRVRMSRPRAFAAMVGLAALALAGGPWSQASARSVGGRISLSSLYWMFYKEDFNHINAKDPALIRQIVAGPAIYVLEQRLGGTRLPGKVIPAEIFFSSAGLQAAIDHDRVIPGVKFVTDDLENLRITPAPERKNPIPAMKDFAHTAHSNGYQPILVPGRDLMRVPQAVCSQQSDKTISQAYLRCGVPRAAAYAPIYVIQASAVETDLSALRQLVQQGAAQARKANPNVIVFATLSVSPNGADIPYTAVVKAAKEIRPYVQGFAMNNIRPTDSRMINFLIALSTP
jgi:hypothetical protein